jgi:hypothetical protein
MAARAHAQHERHGKDVIKELKHIQLGCKLTSGCCALCCTKNNAVRCSLDTSGVNRRLQCESQVPQRIEPYLRLKSQNEVTQKIIILVAKERHGFDEASIHMHQNITAQSA